MSVFYNKQRDTWACEYTENDKKKRKSFPTQKLALEFQESLNKEERERLTVGELVAIFFKNRPDYHPRNKKNIVYLLAGHKKGGKHIHGSGEFLLQKYADALTKKDLTTLRNNLLEKGTSPATCNRYQSYISAILQWGVSEEYIIINPWRDIRKLKEKKMPYLTQSNDLKRIIDHAPPWFQWACYTCYALSLRFGLVELFSLQWSAFNWRDGSVQVIQGKSGHIKKVYPPVEYLQTAFERFQTDTKNGISLVCHREGSRVLSYKTTWYAAKKKAGLQGSKIRPYDLRHESASDMLQEADPIAVSRQLGHASPSTTVNFYGHTSPNAQKSAGEKLRNFTITQKTEPTEQN